MAVSVSSLVFLLLVLGALDFCMASQIGLGSRLLAKEDQAWISDNGTFAFGFTGADSNREQFQLAIWFANLPGDRTVIWSANRYVNNLLNIFYTTFSKDYIHFSLYKVISRIYINSS